MFFSIFWVWDELNLPTGPIASRHTYGVATHRQVAKEVVLILTDFLCMKL